MSCVGFATVLPGAKFFNEGNVNKTYRGQVLLPTGIVVGAIIKDLEQRQLVNELLAFTLARALALPTPDIYLGIVPPTNLHVSKAPTLYDGSRVVFVSADVRTPNLLFQLKAAGEDWVEIIEKIGKWPGLSRLYAFDVWIANIDRHPGNLLFGTKDELWLIDHGHCFTGPNWGTSDLIPENKFRNRLAEWLTMHLTIPQRRSACLDLGSFVVELAGIELTGVSEDSRIDRLLSVDDLAALLKFLDVRIQSVKRHASEDLGIPELV